MPFILEYEKGGKIVRNQFNSYYECTKKKGELRKQGIEFEYKETGGDVTQNHSSKYFTPGEKKRIAEFLKRCDKIKDLRNAKQYEKRKANGRIGKKSNQVG